MRNVSIILGPTGVGKTQIALAVAGQVCAEIVSADSRQLYRGMDIGTAKPSPSQRREVPHHLIDVADPDASFSAAEYARLARVAIDEIDSRGRVPLVVGGAGLYIRALTEGLFPGPAADQTIRQRLRRRARELGIESLHRRLSQVDPDAASRLHPRDVVRIVRALEVYELTGSPISRLQKESENHSLTSRPLKIGIQRDREELYQRIDGRVDDMMAAGLLREVEALLDRGYSSRLVSLQTVGYKELVDHLEGKLGLEEAVRLIKRNTRRYAKRQLTWFRNESGIQWIDVEGEKIDGAVEQLISMLEHTKVIERRYVNFS